MITITTIKNESFSINHEAIVSYGFDAAKNYYVEILDLDTILITHASYLNILNYMEDYHKE